MEAINTSVFTIPTSVVEVVFQLAATLLLFLFIKKKVYPNFREYLVKRKDYINNSIQETKKSQEEAKKLEEEQKSKLQDVQTREKEIIKSAQLDAERIKKETTEKAKKESEIMIEKGQNQLKNEKELVEKEINSQILSMAIEVSEKFMNEKISEKRDMQLIEEALAKVTNE